MLAGAVSGLRGPCLWPAFAFCPFLLSCWAPSKPFFPCPGLPLHGHVRTLPQDPYLALGNSARPPLEASQGQERRWCSPVHKPSLQSRDSSQKNMPVSMQCRGRKKKKQKRLPEPPVRCGCALSGGQSILLPERPGSLTEDLCHDRLPAHLPGKLALRSPPPPPQCFLSCRLRLGGNRRAFVTTAPTPVPRAELPPQVARRWPGTPT